MREFLGFSKNWDENRLNEIGGLFPVGRIFSLIGTNHTDYNLARLAVGSGSDGLVQMDHAYVKGSSRAFVYRSHSGPPGIYPHFLAHLITVSTASAPEFMGKILWESVSAHNSSYKRGSWLLRNAREVRVSFLACSIMA